MKINIEINDDLIAKAKELSGIEDEKELIENALQLFIAIENRKQILGSIGKIEFYEDAFV
ncbi:MAG: Bacterial antitoxin of type system, VapB [Mucilaginibacter sp.]|nr:Bacterial antitoxin of type system, VapB [Mucilaginibacter sp.]